MSKTNKEQFKLYKNWLKRNGLAENRTVNHYASIMENAYALEEINASLNPTIHVNINLYSYRSSKEFLNIQNIIRNAPSFKTVNEEYGSGELSASMNKYQKFLEETEKSSSLLNEELFVEWMQSIPNPNGNKYKDETIKTYTSNLRQCIMECAKDLENINNNLFFYNDVNEFIGSKLMILESPLFKEANGKGRANGQLMSSLSMYERFLEERTSAMTVTPQEEEESHEAYTKQDLYSNVFLPNEELDKIVRLIKHKKNLILQGSPGVGKTFLAKELAYFLLGEKDEERIELIQFHQSYTYERFIMGLLPTPEGGYSFESGVFLTFCEKAIDNPTQDYVFIIDEINRGNISKIFGETLMLIERDKRCETYQIKLPDNNFFYIPNNLYLIGLMNTADRGLAFIDYALRRRFGFYTMEPAFSQQDNESEEEKKFENAVNLSNNENLAKTIKTIEKLNTAIHDDPSLGKGFCIGHSYFTTFALTHDNIEEKIKDIIHFEIIPLLEEYWFDNPKELETWTDKLNKL